MEKRFAIKRRIRHVLHVIKCKLLYENRVVPALYKLLCKMRLIQPYMVFYVDGGICSQMHQYLLGRYYAELGIPVAYDLGWYRRNGMDNNHIFERKFEFCEMWPKHEFEKASDGKVGFYSRVFPVRRQGMHFPLEVKPPKYFGGYYFFDDNEYYGTLFRRVFALDHCSVSDKTVLISQMGEVKCAVHVRRGDLANMDDVFYGKVTLDYFSKAMTIIKERFANVKFYFFSDELEWVERNLLSYCNGSPYELMRGNKAWEDLCLMAHCDCFISSQGSAGKVAALMNGKGLLIVELNSQA